MKYDFAISYAGEDAEVARKISQRLQENSRDLDVFLAEENTELLIGVDGEQFFERLFTDAKQVIVVISKHYKHKQWTRLEWDIILDRANENRFIPIRLDASKLIGLPSNIIHCSFDGSNYEEIVDICIKKLILYDKKSGHHRPSEYEKILASIKYDSKGATAQAFQLVRDNRTRTPLGDCDLPDDHFIPCYEVIEEEWSKLSTIRRLFLTITVPSSLRADELRFNLKHCTAIHFNKHKPDAVKILAYVHEDRNKIGSIPFSAGRSVFAPFGKLGKALDGFAYNIPVKAFNYTIDFAPSYFTENGI